MGALEIGEYAFGWCETITKLALPETLLNIKDGAFAACSSIENVVLPASLQSIDGNFHCSISGSIVALNDNLVWRQASRPSVSLYNRITVYCNPGSTSQQHAHDWGMKTKLLSEYPY